MGNCEIREGKTVQRPASQSQGEATSEANKNRKKCNMNRIGGMTEVNRPPNVAGRIGNDGDNHRANPILMNEANIDRRLERRSSTESLSEFIQHFVRVTRLNDADRSEIPQDKTEDSGPPTEILLNKQLDDEDEWEEWLDGHDEDNNENVKNDATDDQLARNTDERRKEDIGYRLFLAQVRMGKFPLVAGDYNDDKEEEGSVCVSLVDSIELRRDQQGWRRQW